MENGLNCKKVDDFCMRMGGVLDELDRAKAKAEENDSVNYVSKILCKAMLDKFTFKEGMTQEQLVTRAYHKVIKNVVNYINDMALDKEECSQMLQDIFKNIPKLQYDALANKMFGVEVSKVDLFSQE